MNENKHTPEPWRVEIGEQPECIAVLCTSGLAHFEIVSDSQLGDIHADARRIVACVNACAGFSTETLELIASVGGMQHKMTATAAVASQRDELLAALDVALENLRPHGDNCFVSDHYEGDPGAGCNCGIDGVTDYLISTIARAKGEQ